MLLLFFPEKNGEISWESLLSGWRKYRGWFIRYLEPFLLGKSGQTDTVDCLIPRQRRAGRTPIFNFWNSIILPANTPSSRQNQVHSSSSTRKELNSSVRSLKRPWRGNNTRAGTATDNSLTVNIPTRLNRIQHAHTVRGLTSSHYMCVCVGPVVPVSSFIHWYSFFPNNKACVRFT